MALRERNRIDRRLLSSAGLRIRGVLPERREVPTGQLNDSMGIHAGGNRHYPRRGAESEKGTRDLTHVDHSTVGLKASFVCLFLEKKNYSSRRV